MAGAWYVGRASWRRRWRGLVFLGLIAGLVGGAVLGALAGARRTATAYDRLAAATDNPNELLFVAGREHEIEQWLRDSPDVERIQRAAGLIGRRAPEQDWYSLYAPLDQATLRTPVLDRGRFPDPARADEAYVSVRTAANAGIDLGDEVAFHAYGQGQTDDILRDPWTRPNGVAIRLRIVGIVRDPTDAQLSPTTKVVFGTPALAREHRDDALTTLVGVWLRGGPASEPGFERDFAVFTRQFGESSALFAFQSTRVDAESADHASRAVVSGLLIFALVAGIAGLVTVAQTVRRHLARDIDHGSALAALGATRRDRAATQLVASLPYLAVAGLGTVAVAFASSGLFPIGSSRSLEPSPGPRFDALVITGGTVAWLVLLAISTAAITWLSASRAERRTTKPRAARVRGGAGSGRAILPAAIGLQYALLPADEQRALRRMTRTGIVVAFAGLIGSALFVASLHDFTDSPARYGLDFDVTLELPNDGARAVLDRLAADDALEAVGSVRSGTVQVEGRAVEAYSVEPVRGVIDPVLHAGRLPTGASEVAIGPKLMHELHKHIGDAVRVSSDSGSRTLTIVGSGYAPLPESDDFNGGMLLTRQAFDVDASQEIIQAVVRTRPGTDKRVVLARLDREFPFGVSDESLPSAPGPVRNLQQISRLPLALMLFFALLGAAAVVQALFLTASERRGDLAVLRSLGFTRAQSRTVIGSAATGIAVIAAAIGIPIGVVAGRFGWSAITDSLFVAPGIVVPGVAILLATIALVVFANLAALYPARIATRRSPGATLRAE